MTDTTGQAFALGRGSAKLSLMAAAAALTALLRVSRLPVGEREFDRAVDGALASIYGGDPGSDAGTDSLGRPEEAALS